MFDKIKGLGTDTAIYGVSTILGRFLTFLLTPFYVNVLPVDDVGIMATVYAYIAFLNVVYAYGMESAYLKYSSTLELGDRFRTFTVPFLSVLATSLFLSAAITLSSEFITTAINLPSSYSSIITFAAWILFLDAITVVPFAALRMARKAKRFAAIRLTVIAVNVACNAVLILSFDMGIEGVFLSGTISSALAVLLLLPTILEYVRPGWSASLFRALLKFGLPLVPAGLAAMMIQVIDRPILEALTDKATVGIYQANYRLGIFMMLVVSMFDFAWRPFFLTHAQDRDAKQLYARVLTYFTLFMASVFLFLSFFLEDVVKIPIMYGRSILPELYWQGLPVVPVVLLAYMFLGISTTIGAGMYIEKKTSYMPLITFIGAFVNVGVNLLLIPRFTMMGAAVATLLSYTVMAVVLYFIVQRFYPVPYELGRIAKIAFAAGVVFALNMFIDAGIYVIVWKLVLLVLFVVLMYFMKFFEPPELKRLILLLGKGRSSGVRPDVPAGPEA